MSKKMENGLFIFRRDLRIVDNNGLNFLSKICNNCRLRLRARI